MVIVVSARAFSRTKLVVRALGVAASVALVIVGDSLATATSIKTVAAVDVAAGVALVVVVSARTFS